MSILKAKLRSFTARTQPEKMDRSLRVERCAVLAMAHVTLYQMVKPDIIVFVDPATGSANGFSAEQWAIVKVSLSIQVQ